MPNPALLLATFVAAIALALALAPAGTHAAFGEHVTLPVGDCPVVTSGGSGSSSGGSDGGDTGDDSGGGAAPNTGGISEGGFCVDIDFIDNLPGSGVGGGGGGGGGGPTVVHSSCSDTIAGVTRDSTGRIDGITYMPGGDRCPGKAKTIEFTLAERGCTKQLDVMKVFFDVIGGVVQSPTRAECHRPGVGIVARVP